MKLIFSLDHMRFSLAGIGRYTYELGRKLQESKDFEDVKFQFLLGWVDAPDTLIDKYHGVKDELSGGNSMLFGELIHNSARSVYRAISPTVKGVITYPYRKDYIYHSPAFALPNFSGRCVSTIHDMSTFRVPHYHPQSRVKYQQNVFPHLVKKGSLFITDSDFSRDEFLNFFRVPEDRVVSVPLGADPVFRERSLSTISGVLARYGLEAGKYTLCVGTVEPRKNVERLIDAYAKLSPEIRAEWPLVLVGGRGWKSELIHAKISHYNEAGWLKYLAFVNDKDLPMIYSGARLFVFLSHYEGFGLPVLEAMASGTPVISSNAASLPEVGGGAVSYVSPTDDEQIIDALSRILPNEMELQSLSSRGLERAKLFSWDRVSRDTIEAYRRIA